MTMDDGDQSKRMCGKAVKQFACVEVWRRSEEISFQLRSSKEAKGLSSCEMKRDCKVISKVCRTDVVVEDEFVEFACGSDHRFPIFGNNQNQASLR